ncbi:hypothetical protein MYCTH_2312091 [Thermothelomyces thermophilus ATCC 42464]|uniref:HIT-type domain-containing protein n=1 Tax=Thermothelomyces thermophilus (strain ATCC 42464 / BCRC 31852 / DSM 1799) TaxID=573729 RepID=G2QQ25_THET4|nr:uncharacterized protein MYCTH_2312091 [Thermothelomyces thermophilus ATCC 42464]AEO61688.1 hypothetical protein MYCTH_2312091 [Thermothelomyces thermophilus ATCC 42464]
MSLGQEGNSNPSLSDMPVAEGSNPALQSTMLGASSPERTAPPASDPAATDTTPGPEADPFPPQKRPGPKVCGVCGTQPGKYKCPRCSMPYCSVACNKQHKENHPPDPPKPERPSAPNNAQPPDSDSADPYSILLEHRDTFQHLFKKYSSLAAELTRIQEMTLPPSDAPDPPGGNAANMGRNRQQPWIKDGGNMARNRQQPWTKDVGLRRGVEALRKARTDPSDTGDGVREFCELVKLLLNKRTESIDKVREEVVAEETKQIERLLREEGGR